MAIDHAETAEFAEENLQSTISASSASSACKSGDAERIVEIARGWIGTPYVHQASLKGVGCDCLGLLRGLWRELRGEEPEETPPYAPDWAEAAGSDTLYIALKRHAAEIPVRQLAPGDIALFRMLPHGPAKHCGIVAAKDNQLTLIHARQNKRVSEEPLSLFWRSKLAYAFRLQGGRKHDCHPRRGSRILAQAEGRGPRCLTQGSCAK